MITVRDVCRQVRSKNAGPFWVTIDLFFDSRHNFVRYADCPALAPERIAALYDADPDLTKRFAVKDLNVVKFSYPRPTSQGGRVERDLHSGQQYVRLLDVVLDDGAIPERDNRTDAHVPEDQP
jgi:hypothetical protein